MRKWILLVLAAALLLPQGIYAKAEETEETEEVFHTAEREPGLCGETVSWSYAEGKLTVEGTGPMDDFPEGAPWAEHREEIRELELLGGVTYIGAYAFYDYDSLEILKLGDSLTEIGTAAFSRCDGLTAVELPAAFRVFGKESFSHCRNLTEFYFGGGMPKFKLNCLWDTYAKLIYPAQRPWPIQHIEQLEEAFKGRIEFLSSDGTDPYVPEEETEPAETTEVPTTEETAAQETTAPAEETTVPVTEAPSEPPTEQPTEKPSETPETESVPAETYVELPNPEEPEKEKGERSLPIGLIALMAVSGGGALLLMGRMSRSTRKSFKGDFSEILLEDEKKNKKKKRKPTVAQKTAARSSRKKGGKYRK